MKLAYTKGLLLAALFLFCRVPLRAYDVPAPGGRASLSIETVPPNPDLYQLLPTVRMRLQTAGNLGGWVLVDGLKTMCSTDARWLDSSTLWIRLSESHQDHLHVHDGEVLGGITLKLVIHTDEVLMRSASPDGQWSLVELKDCEDEHWALYLRKVGAPDYDQATGTGWADASLFGGLVPEFPLLELDWTGPRSVCAVVGRQPFGVKFRPKVGPVGLEVVYDGHYRRPPERMQVVARSRRSFGGFMDYFRVRF